MGLRPAKTCRHVKGQPWTRVSQKKPRKSFVKGVPHARVRQFNMGTDKRYELEAKLVAAEPIQVRDNALESARQAANKFLEKKLVANFFLQVTRYPHLVLREHSVLGVAGSDRISKGMKRAFGRPKGRMACLHANEAVFVSRIMKKDLAVLREAFERAKKKLPGAYRTVLRDISNDSVNLARKEHVFKKKEEPKPVAEAAPVAVVGAPPAEGGTKEEAVATAGGEEKKK